MNRTCLFLIALALLMHVSMGANDTILVAWGDNSDGLLLQSDVNPHPIPLEINLGSFGGIAISSISIGAKFGVAADLNGNVYTWGSNTLGQLGTGSLSNHSLTAVQLTALGPIQGSLIIAVVASADSALVLADDGLLYTWGSNAQGQLGNGTDVATFSRIPVLVNQTGQFEGAGSVESVLCGKNFCGTLTNQKVLLMWGSNENGQVGLDTGNIVAVSLPTRVNMTSMGILHFTQVSCGTKHVLALTNDSQVVSWGSNTDAQLGYGTQGGNQFWPRFANFTAPVGDRVIRVSAGNAHSLVLTTQGLIYGWGLSQNFQLGNTPNPLVQETPVAFPLQYFWGRVTHLYGYSDSSFAISEKGRFYAWGAGRDYILANNRTTSSVGPIKLNDTNLPVYYAVSSFQSSCCAPTAFAFADYVPPTPEVAVPPGTPVAPSAADEPPEFDPNPPVPLAPGGSTFTPTGAASSNRSVSSPIIIAVLLVLLSISVNVLP